MNTAFINSASAVNNNTHFGIKRHRHSAVLPNETVMTNLASHFRPVHVFYEPLHLLLPKAYTTEPARKGILPQMARRFGLTRDYANALLTNLNGVVQNARNELTQQGQVFLQGTGGTLLKTDREGFDAFRAVAKESRPAFKMLLEQLLLQKNRRLDDFAMPRRLARHIETHMPGVSRCFPEREKEIMVEAVTENVDGQFNKGDVASLSRYLVGRLLMRAVKRPGAETEIWDVPDLSQYLPGRAA